MQINALVTSEKPESREMRIFYIDCGSDLPFLKQEFQVIRQTHTVVSDFRGTEATYEKIFNAASLKKADILHISAHFGEENGKYGFIISGEKEGTKEILTDDDVLKIAGNIGAKLVFLNGCATVISAPYLKKNGIPAVISNSRNPSVDDRDAWCNSILFYRELLDNGGNIKRAYDTSLFFDKKVEWTSNGGYIDESTQVILDVIRDLKSQVEAGQRKIISLQDKVDLNKTMQINQDQHILSLCGYVKILAIANGVTVVAVIILTVIQFF